MWVWGGRSSRRLNSRLREACHSTVQLICPDVVCEEDKPCGGSMLHCLADKISSITSTSCYNVPLAPHFSFPARAVSSPRTFSSTCSSHPMIKCSIGKHMQCWSNQALPVSCRGASFSRCLAHCHKQGSHHWQLNFETQFSACCAYVFWNGSQPQMPREHSWDSKARKAGLISAHNC